MTKRQQAQITLALIDTAENSFETVRLLQRQAATAPRYADQ